MKEKSPRKSSRKKKEAEASSEEVSKAILEDKAPEEVIRTIKAVRSEKGVPPNKELPTLKPNLSRFNPKLIIAQLEELIARVERLEKKLSDK